MMKSLAKLNFYSHRSLRGKLDLLWLLTKKEITLKYKRTILGIFWSLLNPILLSLVLYLAFKIFLKIQMENYLFFFLSALFPWNWFSASTTMATITLINNVNLIKKIRFPKHFLILAVVLAQFINLLFSLPIIVGLAWFHGKGIGISWLVGIPILIVIHFTVTMGICFLTSIINAYFRDMEYLVGVAVSMLFWMTPIIYPLEMVPEAYRIYLALNPLTYLVTSWRDIFMLNTINWVNMSISLVTSLFFFFLGIFIFQKLGRKLDEVL